MRPDVIHGSVRRGCSPCSEGFLPGFCQPACVHYEKCKNDDGQRLVAEYEAKEAHIRALERELKLMTQDRDDGVAAYKSASARADELYGKCRALEARLARAERIEAAAKRLASGGHHNCACQLPGGHSCDCGLDALNAALTPQEPRHE